jgi:hypothetical protein
MPHRLRIFQERLAYLNDLWRFAPPEVRPGIEHAMLDIITMEEAIFRAQERAERAEQRLAHAEEIVHRLDMMD